MYTRQVMKMVSIDTTDKIWDYKFLCDVPMLQARSVEDIRGRGVRISGIEKYDREIPNLWSTVWISIADMIDHYKSGVHVRVKNMSDTKIIFEYISEHLAAWHQMLDQGINIGGAPFEDLIIMDRFANTVFDIAKYDMNKAQAHCKMLGELSQAANLSTATFFSDDLKKKVFGNDTQANGVTFIGGHDPLDNQVPQRAGAEDFFKNKFLGNRG